MRSTVAIAAALALAACNQKAGPASKNDSTATTPDAAQNETAPIPPPATGPDARTPLGIPTATVDPKSAEAARQVVQHYAALWEQHRFDEAASLWSDRAAAAKFAQQMKYPGNHLEIGKPRNSEGAAGSIYTTVPVIFYGEDWPRPADAILRRVNDVPGSTEEQRRWHIERIEWKAGD
ncbi:MAG: hypothetical protein ACJ8FO_12610 [Sphingomicrobium sp.]